MEIGFHKSTEPFEFDESRWFVGEKPEVLDAFRVLSKEGYYIAISGHDYAMRKARLGRPTDKPSSDTPSTLNPALAEAASQFNDALLDEQGKKIAELTKENERLKDQIAILDACKKHNDKIDRNQIKSLGKEIAKLNGIIHDKNAVLSDVAEELRLSKIREENLTEVCQKYMKENEELKKELADKVVDKIDTQALKSAESALDYKEKVIADLDNELAATKKELEAFKESYKRRIKEDSEHFEHIQKICNVGLQKWLIESEYLEKDKPFCFPQLPELSEEEEEKLTAKILDFNAKCMKAARESINDVFESYAAKYAKSSLDDLKEKAYESFNAKAHSLGLVGSKEGNGLLNQMIGADIAEEGGDHSAIIVQCYKDITTISKDEAEIIERCTKNGTKLHYSEKDGFTYTNMYGEEMPIRCLRGMFHVFTDEEIKNMKK